MRKLIFGDSLAAGRLGISFRHYLSEKLETHAIEGDTWRGITFRALTFLQKKEIAEPTLVIIQGGGNDLLSPYMNTHQPLWNKISQKRDPRFLPISETPLFIEEFTLSIERLLSVSDYLSLLFLSIPPLGEDLESELNQKVRERNTMMREIVTATVRSQWCDITTPLEKAIKEGSLSSSYLLGTPSSVEQDALFVQGDVSRAQQLSKERNLVVTIDGIHPNDVGAKLIASTLEERLHT